MNICCEVKITVSTFKDRKLKLGGKKEPPQNPGARTQLSQVILWEGSGQANSQGFGAAELPRRPLLYPPPTSEDAASGAPTSYQDQYPASFRARQTLKAADAENKKPAGS